MLGMNKGKKIAVVGAGIAGLSCAYELQKAGAGVDVVVYEKADFVGGRMASRKKDGIYFDIGADHLCNLYYQMKDYCQELGLEWQEVDFLNYRIFKDGELVELKDALGLTSKVRIALQYFRKRKVFDFFDLSNCVQYDTENAYDYIERKLGKEVSDYLVDGFSSTYQFHGSHDMSLGLFFGFIDSVRDETNEWDLYHLKGGMSALPEALAARVDVRLGEEVKRVVSDEKIIIETDGKSEEFDAVVLASTADVALKILDKPGVSIRELLENTDYSKTISVSFRVDREKLPDISVVWVPKKESSTISSYVNQSMKGEELIRNGKTLLNAWIHESFAEKIMKKNDMEIFAAVKVELAKFCPWVEEADLENFDLQRWEAAMPKFSQGHLTRVDDFLKAGHQGEDGIYLCGDYMNSLWIEGALRCGQRVAKSVLNGLQ